MPNNKIVIPPITSVIGKSFIDKFVERAVACSKIRVSEEEVKIVVNSLFTYISYFNSLGAHDTRALDRDLEDVEIIDELSGFITPASIRDTISDLNSTDILVRTSFEPIDKVVISYDHFMTQQITFRGYFKKDIKESMSKLASLKSDDIIANLSSRFVVEINGELRGRYVSNPYIPILVDSRYAFLKRPEYFNATADEILSDYLAPITF